MAQDLLTQKNPVTLKSHSTLPQDGFVKTSFKRKVNFFDLLHTNSSIVVGYKKSSKSNYDFRERSKKTYVQKVFLELVHKFSDEQIQKLLYLDLYQEICNETKLQVGSFHNANPLHCPASPYFVQGQKFARSKHAPIKSRFLKMAQKRGIQVQAKDPFQLACTLGFLWEQAARIVDQQKQVGSHLYLKAEALILKAKELPAQFSPFEEKKTLVHISTFKMPAKSTQRKLKNEEKLVIQESIDCVLLFGYEYYGLHASFLKTHL